MGDLAGAVQSFHWFAQEFPDDSGDPGQYLCWTLAMYRAGHLHEAVSKLREAMLQNRFLLPRLLGRNVEGMGISPDSDELEMMRLDHIPEEYFAIWGERELLWASTLYDGEFSAVRARYLEIERELEHEPRGERRVRLVNELFGMKRSNHQDRSD